jgi:hypothetical protein
MGYTLPLKFLAPAAKLLGIDKKAINTSLKAKFKRHEFKGAGKAAPVTFAAGVASTVAWLKAQKLGIYPSVPSKKTTSPSKGLGTMKGGRGNQGSGSAFDKAFRKAKDEGKAKFPWRGRMYHTRTKKEETAYKAKALYGRK